jgi:hypothetical protein
MKQATRREMWQSLDKDTQNFIKALTEPRIPLKGISLKSLENDRLRWEKKR